MPPSGRNGRTSVRVSRPPTPVPQPLRGIWRALIAVVWVSVQAGLVLTAGRRADGAFGFRMFSESSTIKVALYREVVGSDGARSRLHVEGGEWVARDASGFRGRFGWTDRVRVPALATFDVEIPASYGVRAQLERWQAALDDVSSHVADAETARFVLDITVRRNGREPYVVTLTSPERPVRGGH